MGKTAVALKLDGKPLRILSVIPTRLLSVLLDAPANELFTAHELARKLSCCRSSITVAGQEPALLAYSVKYKRRTLYGSLAAIREFRRQLETE